MAYITPIKLKMSEVPRHLRNIDGYKGRKFKAAVSMQAVHIPMDAGLWSGGSREKYMIVRLADGKEVPAVNHQASPWNGERTEKLITLEPGFAVVEHSMFCGKDMGLVFYMHPIDAAPMLEHLPEGSI